MATVLTPPAPTPTDARLDRELSKAVGRVRLNDLVTGALALAVLTLGYAAAAIALDRWLDLPGWVRQAGLGGFLLAAAAVGVLLLVRPLRRAVNPRFVARRVEGVMPDAKNVLINWVDLTDRDLPAAVRAAVGSRAAAGVADADVNRAFESRKVVWLGAAAGLLFAALAVLFVVFKPAPFLSLVGRTFNPFTAAGIATRTELTVTDPAAGDVTVTAGDPLTITVFVGGSVPDADGPKRVRLLVRHTPTAPDADELPLEPGATAREWVARVPPSVVQNGFWYRVAGSDAVTLEYRVTVRSRPAVKEFEARYEYPAYTRLKPEVGREPKLEAYRGTRVTLTVTTNRHVKKGWMEVAGQPDPVPGEVVGEAQDALAFRLTLADSGAYRVGFTSAEDETAEPTPPYPIKVLIDQVPTAEILTPAEDEITLPANGLLKVDGVFHDDFGVASAALMMRVTVPDAKPVPLKPKPYRDGKSFRREADGTWPTTLEYKDSVALGTVTDPAGQPVKLADRMVLEYWLEATDNCTVPHPNVGKSAVKRVRLGPPETQPEKPARDRQQRRAEEQQHHQKQDQLHRDEKRDPPPQPRPDVPRPGPSLAW